MYINTNWYIYIFLQILKFTAWIRNQGVKVPEALVLIQMILRIEEEGSMIDHHLRGVPDIVGHDPGIGDLAPVLETGEEKTPIDPKIGSSKLHHLNHRALCLIQAVLQDMFQQYIINTRYLQIRIKYVQLICNLFS